MDKTSYNPFNLSGRKILITGASSGIGKAVAKVCAGGGAEVIITGRDSQRLDQTAREIAESGGACTMVIADLTVEEDVKNLIDQCGAIDGLALCAGAVDIAPVQFCTQKKMSRLADVNFFAPVNLCQKLLKAKKLKDGSSVVAITSVLGVEGFMVGNAAYGTSKAALESWIKYCALEYASKNIRFNTILPGGIDTPMADLSGLTQEQKDEDIAKVPMGRYGNPQEIANCAIFFLSNASSFVTGASLIADGGRILKY